MIFKNWGKKETVDSSELSLLTRIGPVPISLVERSKALEEWSRRASRFEQTQVWPLLLGPKEDLHEFANDDEWISDLEGSPDSVVAEANSVDLRQFLEERKEECLGDDEDEDEDEDEILSVDARELDAKRKTSTSVTAIDGVNKSRHTHVGVVELPCDAPWKVLSIRPLGLGEGPEDGELTAVLKSWYERFGAVPIGCPPHGVLELWLNNPITDPDAAVELALEMFAVCPDIVYQGVGNVQALAQELLNASCWFLWWD